MLKIYGHSKDFARFILIFFVEHDPQPNDRNDDCLDVKLDFH